MMKSMITTNGQVTLPRAVMEALELKAGDQLRYIFDDRGVRIIKVEPVARLAGVLKRDGPVVSIGSMDEAVAESAAARDRER